MTGPLYTVIDRAGKIASPQDNQNLAIELRHSYMSFFAFDSIDVIVKGICYT